jgi:hypothetical protein
MWQGLQTITDYKGKPSRELSSDVSLLDELKFFYTPFKASNTEPCMRAQDGVDDCVIMLSVARPSISLTFTDGLPGRILSACADQLASVFTDIFNLSLT